jgi:hypothetical protein
LILIGHDNEEKKNEVDGDEATSKKIRYLTKDLPQVVM